MRTRYLAIGLAAVVAAAVGVLVNVVPASRAPDSVPDQRKSAWTAAQVEEWQKHLGSNVSVGPGSLEGEAVDEDPGGVNGSLGIPDQPAGW
jgi:hypothetical protein